METSCGFFVKSKNVKDLELLAEMISRIIDANERDFFDTVSEIDEENKSFSVNMESGCGVDAVAYVMAIDYLLDTHFEEKMYFEIEGVEDLDCGSYTAFTIIYDNGEISIKSMSFEVEGAFEPDCYDDGEDDDFFEDDSDSLSCEEYYEDAEEKAFERLKEVRFETDLSKHGLMGSVTPISQDILDTIEIDF